MKKNLIYLALCLLCTGLFFLYLSAEKKQTDTRPPVISFAEGVPELSTADPTEAYLQGVTATDDQDGDVTASVVVSAIRLADTDGTVSVTYAAFDSAGNVSTAVRRVKYTDYNRPVFSLKKSLTFAYSSGFDLFSITEASDDLDGDISHRIRITSLDSQSVSAIGTHQVQLRVTNSLGDTVELVVPVEVYAAGTYNATLTLTDYLIYLPAGSQLDPNSYLESYIRGSTTFSLENGIPEDCSLEIKNYVQSDVPGVYTVEYRLTQTLASGTAYTGYAKLIVIVEG